MIPDLETVFSISKANLITKSSMLFSETLLSYVILIIMNKF